MPAVSASRPVIAGGAEPGLVLERFSLAGARERWPDFLLLEHETLPLPVGFGLEGDALLVYRRMPRGRRIRDGRVPRHLVPDLLLQAASSIAFFRAYGFWLEEEDLADAYWERESGRARLWLARSPAALRGGSAPPASAVLGAFLDRLARRGGRIDDREARGLAERLEGPDSRLRRAEFGVAEVFRSFPSLHEGSASTIRLRTIGYAGRFLRDLTVRARLESARVILESRLPHLFLPGGSALAAGSALHLDPPPSRATEASRRLRELARSQVSAGRSVWIAAGIEHWDPVSRRAFETAERSLPAEIEVRRLPAVLPAPRLPDEWRREIFVPCGSFAGALRFYECVAGRAQEDPAGVPDLVRDWVSSDHWAAFASDSTGQAPLPQTRLLPQSGVEALTDSEREVLTWLSVREGAGVGATPARPGGLFATRLLSRLTRRGHIEETRLGWRLTAAGRRGVLPGPEAATLCRRWARQETDRAARIELLLSAGAAGEALAEAEHWFRESPPGCLEAWFELAARFSAARVERPPWLDAIEAERELAGGRPVESRAILDRIVRSRAATEAERRAACLRGAEVSAQVEGASGAGQQAASWRRAFPGAPPGETVRALRLEAAGLARDGRHDRALECLGEADLLAQDLGAAARLENALTRASILSRQGLFEEEARIYEHWKEKALHLQDDVLAARFFSQEALGLCDRRKFAEAADRLEAALAVLRDDPAEGSRISIDLATTLYHSGRSDRCATLLAEAAALASAAGRRDLLRIARSNQIELWVARAEWQEAAGAIEDLLGEAQRQGDDLWLLVGLHQRSRMALRRGLLGRAAEDNARARELAMRLGDRIEIGELWLEEGDRRLYERDAERARQAWERAAQDLPDRCDTERVAAARLEELAWSGDGGPPAAARQALSVRLGVGEYAAAETGARWHLLFPGDPGIGELALRAERILRDRGGESLADFIFGRPETAPAAASVPPDSLRALREALVRGLAGEETTASLEAVGVSGLAIADADGREIVRLGRLPETECASRALEAGASTYRLTLPRQSPGPVAAAVAELAETLLFRLPTPRPADGHREGWRRFGIVTEDPAMEEPYRRLTRFAAQPVTVLVRGESGSGKEAVARAVHALSPRASGPFVAVNVPAIPAALLESELFGHVRGAFTGAERDRLGLLEEACRGTVFFDEIGDLESSLQAKLLRALQDREIRRLGENRSRRIDVRVVSATSRDLAQEVEAGRFREDLYYRLHVAVIALPPLRERGRDTLRLARHFLEVFGREYGRGALRLSPEAVAAIAAHSWPGNVRELQNAMAQAAALADSDGVVGLGHLPEAIRSKPRSPTESYRSRLDAHRKGMISDALARAGGNRSHAARELGLSRQALRYLMKELNVFAPPSPRGRSGAPSLLAPKTTGGGR
ncbi:MAG TPA: sigma 54-interacting transcriptional regulator [Thermoanaerobaculia bacterium]|nr:sigma 54-interacting transcriptional regulator [Thermoanaerobaculia bacterium]